MFVIRNKTTGQYLKTRKNGYQPMTFEWVDDIERARVYSRKCDASNSILGFAYFYQRKGQPHISRCEAETVPVTVSVSISKETKSPTTDILSDFQARFNALCKEASEIRDKLRELETEIESVASSFEDGTDELESALDHIGGAIDHMSTYV